MLFFIAGICININRPIEAIILFLISIILNYSINKYFSWNFLLIALFCSICGCYWTDKTDITYKKKKESAEQITNTQCTGVVTECKKNGSCYSITFYTKAIKDKNNLWRPLELSLALSCQKPIPIAVPIHIKCTIFKNSCPNISQIMQKKNIHGYGYCHLLYPLNASHKSWFFYNPISYFATAINNIREKICKDAALLLSGKTNILFQTIFMGRNSSASSINEQNEKYYSKNLFTNWGISHYLARSGLHINLLIVCIMFLLSFFNFSYKFSTNTTTFIIILFCFFSFNSLSFSRALVMWIILTITKNIEESPSSMHLFCICSLFFLIYNPSFLFALDFQLSFGATMLLIWIFYTHTLKEQTFVK